MKAIIGLGNPGQKYAKTRHNLGFMVIDELVRRLAAGTPRERLRAHIWEARLGDERVILAKPQTYMNLSGVSAQQVRNWYKVADENILVIYDDVDLDFGVLRLRERGSAGGHNGLTSIVEALGTTDLPRLRIGVGRGRSATTAHVLSGFSPAEEEQLNDVISKAADGAAAWVQQGSIPAMNKLNPREKPPRQASRPKRAQVASEDTADTRSSDNGSAG